MTIEGPDWLNEKAEKQKSNSPELKTKFLSEFTNDLVSWEDRNKNIDRVINSESLSSDLDWDSLSNLMQKFKDENNGFENFDVKEITLYNLKRSIWSHYFTLNNARNNYIKNILWNYNLTKSQKSELENSDIFTKKSVIELNKLTKKEIKNEEFLADIFWEIPLKKDLKFDFLPELTQEQKSERMKWLRKSEIEEIKKFNLYFKSGLFNPVLFTEVLKTGYFKDKEKIDLITNFLPFITLKEAKDFGILSDSQIETKKKDLVSGLLLDKEIEEKIIKTVNLNDIEISTSDLELKEAWILEILENKDFSHVEDNFRDIREEVKKDENKNWPQNIFSIQEALREKNIQDVEKLEKGVIVKLSKTDKKFYNSDYFRIESFDEKNKKINLMNIWRKSSNKHKTIIDLNSNENMSLSFYDFVNYNKWESSSIISKMELFKPEEFSDLIKDKEEYLEKNNSLKSITEDDLRNDPEIREKSKNDYTKKLNNDILELNEQLDSLESNSKLSKDDKRIKELKIKSDIQFKNEELKKIENGEYNDLDLIANTNFIDLLENLDNEDLEGKKLGLEKWIIVEIDGVSYEIMEVKKELSLISIKTIRWKSYEDIHFDDFFKTFKKEKARRKEKVNNFEELFTADEFKWHEIVNGTLIKKDVDFNDKREDKEIDYLVSKDWELIKLENIENWFAEIRFWELDWVDKKGNDRTQKIKLEEKVIKISLNELKTEIDSWEYKMDWKIWKEYKEKTKDWYENDISSKFWTRYFNRASISELFSAWEQILDSVSEFLKKWNQYKSSQLALKFAKLLPWEMSADIVAQMEVKAAEEMDKELTSLGKIWSGPAVTRIRWYLTDIAVPQYKKEAWLMYISKYWNLYAKGLVNDTGKFLWYEALWGKIWDSMFNDAKERAEKASMPFDEKELLISLLWKQCGSGLRRSKFFKEFKWKIAWWFSEELKDGYSDASDCRRIEDINEWEFGELAWGTVAHFVWWLKRAVEKWGSIEQMSELYFCAMFSWALDNVWSNVLEEIQKHWSDWNWMIFSKFAGTFNWKKLFNNTVVDICWDIENVEPEKYKDISSEAKKLFSNAESNSPWIKVRLNNTRKFWSKYWKVLARTLNMVDDNDESFAKTDKLIQFWWDSKYKNYYNHVKEWTAQITAFKKDFMTDAVWESGVTWLDNYNLIKQHFTFSPTRTVREPELVNILWKKNIWNDLKSTKFKVDNAPELKSQYRKYIRKKLQDICAWYVSWVGPGLYQSLENSDPVGLNLWSIWIKLWEFEHVSIDSILEWKSHNEMFDIATENILNWNFGKVSWLWNSNIFNVQTSVKAATEENLDL